jgi:hypothetical protein
MTAIDYFTEGYYGRFIDNLYRDQPIWSMGGPITNFTFPFTTWIRNRTIFHFDIYFKYTRNFSSKLRTGMIQFTIIALKPTIMIKKD